MRLPNEIIMSLRDEEVVILTKLITYVITSIDEENVAT
jgi:hypothetical protein